MNRDIIKSINYELSYLDELNAVLISIEQGNEIVIGYGGMMYNPIKAYHNVILKKETQHFIDFKESLLSMIEKTKDRLRNLGYTGEEIKPSKKSKWN